jgi:hypothetical protein
MTGQTAVVPPDPPDQADEDIVRQVLAGQTGMFELLMRRYNERLYRAARAITRDDREAEDVQPTYLNAFSKLRLTLAEAVARLEGRYADDIAAYETVHRQILQWRTCRATASSPSSRRSSPARAETRSIRDTARPGASRASRRPSGAPTGSTWRQIVPAQRVVQ